MLHLVLSMSCVVVCWACQVCDNVGVYVKYVTMWVCVVGRCGSTIVSQLLHTHEKVAASLSEPPAVAALNRLVIAPHSNPHDNDTWIRW